jgi:hypothetical protein
MTKMLWFEGSFGAPAPTQEALDIKAAARAGFLCCDIEKNPGVSFCSTKESYELTWEDIEEYLQHLCALFEERTLQCNGLLRWYTDDGNEGKIEIEDNKITILNAVFCKRKRGGEDDKSTRKERRIDTETTVDDVLENHRDEVLKRVLRHHVIVATGDGIDYCKVCGKIVVAPDDEEVPSCVGCGETCRFRLECGNESCRTAHMRQCPDCDKWYCRKYFDESKIDKITRWNCGKCTE